MYNWACLSGHSGEIPTGSKLEEMQIKRMGDGFLDAICLSAKQCPECQADQVEHLRREIRLCSEVGCPMGKDDCVQGCMAEAELRESEAVCVTLKNLMPSEAGGGNKE